MKNILPVRKGGKVKKAIRIIGIIAVTVLVFGAIIASTTIKPAVSTEVWDEQMTIGNKEAKNHFIVYSDLVCPYCVAFENAIIENEEEFEEYIEENDILFEIRLSDFLYEYGESSPIQSRHSAIATYCAKNESKFWDYYKHAISEVWNNFFASSGKSGFSKMQDLDQDYWIKLGKEVGLGDSFESCVKNKDPLDEIKATTEKTAKSANGMPYFKFNNYDTSGFDLSWGWDYVLEYFEAGLES